MTHHYDYYTGFEGEPELVFRTSDNTLLIRLWEGYFDDIILNDVPDKNGYWQGLALFYHTDTGWYSSSPFQLTAFSSIIERLRLCNDPTWDESTRLIYSALLFFFEQADRYHKDVIVEYF